MNAFSQDNDIQGFRADADTLNWDADYLLATDLTDTNRFLSDSEWLDALIYDGPGISDMLRNDDTYHLRVGSHDQLVGARFEFSLDARSRVIASGVVHATTESDSGDYYTHFETNLGERKIIVTLKNPATADAVRDFIAEAAPPPERADAPTPTDEQVELAQDGEFPDDMDWNATYALVPRNSEERAPVDEEIWTTALLRGGPDIADVLTSPDPYQIEIGPLQTQVVFFYDFGADAFGLPYADISCHPAQSLRHSRGPERRPPAIDQRRIYVLPDSKRSETLISAYLSAEKERAG